MATASSVSPKKKARSMEARRRRSRNKKTNARVKSQKSPYLLPELCDSDVHEDCVAIDCEMIVVHSKDRSGRNALASVAIVNKELECVYEKFVQPPSDHRINKSSRQFCPVTDQQFEIAHYCPCTLFAKTCYKYYSGELLIIISGALVVVGFVTDSSWRVHLAQFKPFFR